MTWYAKLALIATASLLFACSADSEWVQITSGDVTGDVNICFGDQEVIGRGCGDGSLLGVACFDPPIVPVGSINWLKINDAEIVLEGTTLEDGVLHSRNLRYSHYTGQTALGRCSKQMAEASVCSSFSSSNLQ